jgi:tryptophan halogenase
MPSRADHPDNLRSIAIIGGGSAGWMVAAALANAAGTNISITLVESDEIGTVGVGEATIPPIKSFNAGLGIDEKEFVRATQASFKLGIDFVGWGTADSRYFHPFGEYGADFDRVGLHHYWLRERMRGDATPFDDYAMGWALARDNRFAPPVENPRDVRSTHAYAYHFDAGLYASFLRRYAEARGVMRHEGKVVDVARDPLTGNIAHVQLADGREIAADFFVDCSGFAGLLIERTLEAGHEDWTHWLPCDRALAMPSTNTHPLTPYTRVSAHAAGWQWRIPLQHRQGNGHVYSSRHIGDDEAAAVLRANIGGEALGEPRLLKFGAGRRKRAWSHNCVSLGLAAGFMEPLESTSLHLIQMGVERLLRLLPDRHHDPLNAEEFNRATINEWERIRDFLILHYHASTRPEPFWRECAAMPIPDELAYKLRHFKAQARLVSPDDELFRNPSWLAVYFGQGIIPDDYDRLADARPQVDAPAQLRNLRELMRAAAQTYPLLDDFIARNAAAPQVA